MQAIGLFPLFLVMTALEVNTKIASEIVQGSKKQTALNLLTCILSSSSHSINRVPSILTMACPYQRSCWNSTLSVAIEHCCGLETRLVIFLEFLLFWYWNGYVEASCYKSLWLLSSIFSLCLVSVQACLPFLLSITNWAILTASPEAEQVLTPAPGSPELWIKRILFLIAYLP